MPDSFTVFRWVPEGHWLVNPTAMVNGYNAGHVEIAWVGESRAEAVALARLLDAGMRNG